MRRLWTAAGILAFLCAAALAGSFLLTGFTQTLTDSLSRAQLLAEEGDWAQAAQLTAETARRFQDAALCLHISLRHSDIDAVEISFREVEQLLAHRERPGEYAAANARLIARLELLSESERPSLQNIL